MIKLVRDEVPDRFRLSGQLADLLDTKEDTRAGIVMGIWEYVRINGLQDPEERRTINCDMALRNVCLSAWPVARTPFADLSRYSNATASISRKSPSSHSPIFSPWSL